MNKNLDSLLIILLTTMLFFLTGCGEGSASIGYTPVGVGIRISINSKGEIKAEYAPFEFMTPIGKFDLELEGGIDINQLYDKIKNDFKTTSPLLFVRIGDDVTVFELKDNQGIDTSGIEESGYRIKHLTLKYYGENILLELEPTNKTISSPTDTIKTYYQLMNNGNYKTTWDMLSQNFINKYHSGSSSNVIDQNYIAYWQTIIKTNMKSTKLIESSDDHAVVYIDICYVTKNSTCASENNPYIELIPSPTGDKWLINDQFSSYP